MNTLLYINVFDWMIIVYLILILLFVGILLGGRWNRPTWKGIIISLLIGCLPLYLFLCIIGVLGDNPDNGNYGGGRGNYGGNYGSRRTTYIEDDDVDEQ